MLIQRGLLGVELQASFTTVGSETNTKAIPPSQIRLRFARNPIERRRIFM